MTEENKTETPSLIEQASKEAERLEKATSEMKKENDRREQLMARDRLGGKSVLNPPEEKKVETPREYAKRMLRGG